MNKTFFEVKENTKPSGPLVDIYVPKGQHVTIGSSSTPSAFRIQGTQLFLNVTPDYEVHRPGLGGPAGAGEADPRGPVQAQEGSWGS